MQSLHVRTSTATELDDGNFLGSARRWTTTGALLQPHREWVVVDDVD
jgi:hypothetical protein